MLHALIYISVTIAANLTADDFIQPPVFGQFAIGTLFFGITFTQRDRFHHHGRRFVYTTIFIAALLNLFVSWMGHIEPRIIAASFIAIVIAESADTEIYHTFIKDKWILRVAKSKAVSIPLDTVLFTLIAFYGVLDNDEIVALIFGDTLTKAAISMLFAIQLRARHNQKEIAQIK